MLLNKNFLSIKQDLPKISVVVDELLRDIFIAVLVLANAFSSNLESQISTFFKYSI